MKIWKEILIVGGGEEEGERESLNDFLCYNSWWNAKNYVM